MSPQLAASEREDLHCLRHCQDIQGSEQAARAKTPHAGVSLRAAAKFPSGTRIRGAAYQIHYLMESTAWIREHTDSQNATDDDPITGRPQRVCHSIILRSRAY